MKSEYAIFKAGSVKQLADLLGISRTAVYQWGKDVPRARVWQLKALKPEWFDTLSV